jgi:uncharacterized protein YoaH (UPF0181 family)
MPATDDRQKIVTFVASLTSRVRSLGCVERACRGLVAGTAAAFVYLVVAWLFGAPRYPWSFFAAIFPLAGALLGGLAFGRTWLTDYEAAKLADERLDFKDQLAGAYDFITAGRQETLVQMAIAQTVGKLAKPGLADQAVPFAVPKSFWAFLVLGLVGVLAHRSLFPPPLKPELSEATRRELEEGSKESLAGLLALEADITDEAQKKEFERIRKLIDELGMMSGDATKEEILARLSREIADLDAQAGQNDAMSRALEELKKYRERVAMGDLMDQVQEELNKGADELAIQDASGQKVAAEAITTLALVDKQALAEKRAKQDALAKELKTVAKEQGENQAETAKDWALAEKKEKAGEGTKKEMKTGTLTYDDLRDAVENRDIRTMILTAAGDKTRSTDAYREVFHNYQRILESVLSEQRVPVGQQLYVRRYFKVIRPKASEAGDPRPVTEQREPRAED